MVFLFFAAGIEAAFFFCTLLSLQLGRYLRLRYRKLEATEGMAGLSAVEGAIFGLMGLLLAFTISGALQRFDDRRQLVLQEATAATTAYDRLGAFEGQAGRNLQQKLKDYVVARIDLYRPPESRSLECVGGSMPESRLSAGMFAGIARTQQPVRSGASARRRERETSAADH